MVHKEYWRLGSDLQLHAASDPILTYFLSGRFGIETVTNKPKQKWMNLDTVRLESGPLHMGHDLEIRQMHV